MIICIKDTGLQNIACSFSILLLRLNKNLGKIMQSFMQSFIRNVDALNYRVGRVMMYGIFFMMAVLLWSSVSKTFFVPSLWTLEMAQFAMVAYYMLGGPYSIQMGANVRMDLLYGEWDHQRKAQIDAITVIFLIVYLSFLLWGGWESLMYSISYGGT